MLKILVAFMICSTGYTQELQQEDFEAGAQFGYKDFEMKSEHRVRKGKVDGDKINAEVVSILETPESLRAARLFDLTLARIIQRSVAALNAFDHEDTAAKIEREYKAYYSSFYVDQYFGVSKEIGQHDPMNIWIELVHAAIHIKLGDFWCQYLHVHDLFIINFATPVVLFKNEAFDKLDYLDHFSGHQNGKWTFEHHGLAGVVSYWAATAACGAATAGLGVVSFVCGQISAIVEFGMDKYIAPKIGGAVWEKHNGQ